MNNHVIKIKFSASGMIDEEEFRNKRKKYNPHDSTIHVDSEFKNKRKKFNKSFSANFDCIVHQHKTICDHYFCTGVKQIQKKASLVDYVN